ncbi:phosphate/phosphite/phosphonate ABC transporter substrate-binding protein [Sulfuriferula thiophila]|uniref:phosphate/phosphite/phosphonate ABC transporter substrate-binding protein n=1 Tax=Sulfuriferula thiophila TaxID=1781211 RepID=UPI000F6090C5|nr:phosphate/phosphite/phosphonate ABC transporter substrate-binding protein [Sulfuriferula thiophila]
MNVTRRRLCAALALTALPIAGRAESATLTIGLFPNLPAHRLIELYQPLATYLAQLLGCQVRLFSARDFKTFYQATRDNQFDLVVTAPHLAWLAMSESGWRPLVTFSHSVTGVIVVKQGSEITDPKSCRGKSVAMVDSLAIVSQLGLGYFKAAGLTANTDYRVSNFRNHADAALAVMIAKADCGVVGKLPFQQMVAEVQGKLQIIGETQSVPSQFVMASSRMSMVLSERVRAALVAFPRAPSGATFIKAQHSGMMVAADANALVPIQPYALVTRALLSQGGE